MAWVFQQSTGNLFHNIVFIAKVYSGKGEHKNNPASQHLKNLGPIPRGMYTIGKPQNTDTHGPYVLSLTPSGYNEMFSRDGFLIHGDAINNPGEASEGCIIADRSTREAINYSNDRLLCVI